MEFIIIITKKNTIQENNDNLKKNIICYKNYYF